MPYMITEECISCNLCVEECPIEAITEGKSGFAIDQKRCVGCGSCYFVCPAGAIVQYGDG